MAQMVKNPPAMQETWVRSLCWENPLEEGMATHSSILAWRIPWTEEPGGLQSMGSQSDMSERRPLHFTVFRVLTHTIWYTNKFVEKVDLRSNVLITIKQERGQKRFILTLSLSAEFCFVFKTKPELFSTALPLNYLEM